MSIDETKDTRNLGLPSNKDWTNWKTIVQLSVVEQKLLSEVEQEVNQNENLDVYRLVSLFGVRNTKERSPNR